MTAGRPAILIAATPTPNGDLHVGHLAGPYLAGDIYARHLRGTGRPVRYATCTDDSQTYVLTTAARQGISPQQLCATSTAAIQRSLRAMGISMAPLPPIDDCYRQWIVQFVTALHSAGRLRTRTVRLPYSETVGYLYDGLVSGQCPSCLAGSSGGGCEDCGHPNNYDELLAPTAALDPSGPPVEYREHTILTLPMEEYRDRLTDYFAARQGGWRPHPMQFVRELLAGPLPEIPITVPGSWGIPAPFAPTAGQVLYPWVEGVPAAIYASWCAGADRAEPVDAGWRAETGVELVYFHGFDNTYHWAVMDLVLLMAHGERYQLPEITVCNEFYELDRAKFSTSRNHLIRGVDLLDEVPRDLVRFYLALTAPENQRTNFTFDELCRITERRLVQPWNALADAVSLLGMAGDQTLPTTPDGRRRATVLAGRIQACYQLSGFSIARAANTIADQLARLRAEADSCREPGDLLLQARTLLACAAPILIDLADQASADGLELRLADQPTSITAFELPRLAYPSGAGQDSPTRSPALDGAV
ncbi:MAG TPA: class I tRNA ligase family protein [Jatrophihabitans sp.]|nr:class I tRNA ligase family protein [Jatrophihabitans sp.]